jgi:hypothetical protein
MTTTSEGHLKPLTPEEADRLAAMIRPIWEVGDEALSPSVAPLAGASSAADTIIDAAPMIAVEGDPAPHTPKVVESPPAQALSATAVLPDTPVAPVAPGPTRLGVGEAAGAPPAAIGPQAAMDASTTKLSATDPLMNAAPVVPAVAVAAAAERPPPSSRGRRQGSTGPSVSSAGAGRHSMPRPSAADEPVDIPVGSGSSGMLKLVAILVGVGGLVVGAVLLVGGRDDPSPVEGPKKSEAPAAKSEGPMTGDTPAPAAPTATATAQPADTSQPQADAKGPGEEPKAAAEPKAADPPKKSGGAAEGGSTKPPPPTGPKPGGTKPPPPPAGGSNIIRDAPF